MKWLKVVQMVVVALFIIAISTGYAQENTILLATGQQRVINMPDVSRVAIGDSSIVEVKVVSGNQILIVARRAGNTDLKVWKQDGSITTYYVNVVAADPYKIANEIQVLLSGIEGISVKVVGQMVVIEGHALNKIDFDKLNQICKMYPQVINFVKIHPSYNQIMAQQINASLKSAGIDGVQARVVGRNIFLEGEVPSEDALKKAELIAKSISDEVVSLVQIGVTMRKMILMDVYMVELSQRNINNIGIQWGESLGVKATAGASSTITNQGFSPITGTLNVGTGFGATLNMLSQKGAARILARPKLVCKSGDKAEFLAGGEIPLPAITQTSSTVEFRTYGIKLEFEPVADQVDNVATKILVEVSTLDPSAAVSGIPGLLTRRVNTSMNVKNGQTIALTGLVSHEASKDVHKMPALGHIPIIGELFKSRQFNKRETELVIFVTPHVVDASSPINLELLKEGEQIKDKSDEETGFDILD